MTKKPIRSKPPRPRPPLGVADVRDRHLTGYGSPEGVVAAGAGVAYQDTDPAGSGAQWKKTTPSGNTGWAELGAGGGSTTPYGMFEVGGAETGFMGSFSGGSSSHQIKFDDVRYDPDGLWDATSWTYRPTEPGIYFVGASLYFLKTAATWAVIRFNATESIFGGGQAEQYIPLNAGVYGGFGAEHGYLEFYDIIGFDGDGTLDVWLSMGASAGTITPQTGYMFGWRISDQNPYA